MSDNETSIRAGLSAVTTTTGLDQRGKSNGRASAESIIGFVGLGRMGTAMAANLAAAGYRVIAYVRHADRIDKLAALGLKPTTEIADLFDCEVVISMLPDDDAVRDVVFGEKTSDRWSRLGIKAGRNSSFHEHDKHVRGV